MLHIAGGVFLGLAAFVLWHKWQQSRTALWAVAAVLLMMLALLHPGLAAIVAATCAVLWLLVMILIRIVRAIRWEWLIGCGFQVGAVILTILMWGAVRSILNPWVEQLGH